MEKEFNEAYKKLNSAQKEAVDTIEGPVMVIAGPGTGKTTILTLRIANILRETDTPAHGVLALTFTDSGVKAMRRKLRELIGSRADEVKIHTYHSFAASIINEFDDHFAHLGRTRQINEVEAETLIRDILKSKKYFPLRPPGDPSWYINKILGTISDAKKEAWTPEMLESFATEEIERIKNDETMISSRGASKGNLKAEALSRISKCERTILLAQVYREYEERKQQEHLLDFDDLVFELIQALKTDELLLRLIQEQHLYLLVDEHQDTNDAQNLLIQTIADFFDTPNLFIVGDEKQAIYRFQGASVENFLKFQYAWQSMRLIKLENNYRSHQQILDATHNMIEYNYDAGEHEDLRVRLKASVKHPKRAIDLVTAPDTATADKYLTKQLKALAKDDPNSSIAVIVRTNREVEKLREFLDDGGIEASTERGVDVFAHPLGTVFFELINYLRDPSLVESLAQTIAAGLWELDFTTQVGLIKKIKSGDLEPVNEKIPVLEQLRQEQFRAGAISYLTMVGTESGLVKLAGQDPVSATVWRAIISLASDIAKNQLITNPTDLINALLSYRESATSKNIKIATGYAETQIKIMTAHRAKGLEFDYVFLPYATEESWLPKARGSSFVLPREKASGDEVKDLRRLFYVALTRARQHVEIIVDLEDSTGRALTPLRFIGELDQRQVKETALKATAAKELPQKKLPTQKHQTKIIVDFAKNVLTSRGLSVTALNHYLKCPSQFLYESILKLPQAPSQSSEKGTAMHEALARVWRLEKKTIDSIAQTIETTVIEYFKNSFLAKFEKEPLVDELVQGAPVVAQALLEHFKQPGKVLVEKWEETTFATKIGQEEINLRLHGKLDAIVETEQEVKVFDYKTRGSMSVNEIMGQTANSTGGYFRQLVFYHRLLEAKTKISQRQIEPSLVFVKPDSKGRCPVVSVPIDKKALKDLDGQIQSLLEGVWSGDFLTDRCDDQKCEYCRLRDMVNWKNTPTLF